MPEKILLPDECGDSLWEEVLAQQHDDLQAKKNNESRELPDSPDQKSMNQHSANTSEQI